MNEIMTAEAEREMKRTVHRICRSIRSKKARDSAEREYLEHLEDHVYRLLLRGVPEEKAIAEAVMALGDPEELCHMLGAIHNRMPLDIGTKLLWLAIRALAASFVGCFLWALGLTESHPVVWLLPILVVVGLEPARYLRSLILRIKQIVRIRRVCRDKGYAIECMASPIRSVFISARRPEWVIETGTHTYCVHFLAVHNRHASLHFWDSYAYTLTVTRGRGARFVDRAPRRFNLLLTGDQSYSERYLHSLYFPASPDFQSGTTERILLLNPVPNEIGYRKGTGTEYIGNGDTVFGFTVYDGRSFLQVLKDA